MPDAPRPDATSRYSQFTLTIEDAAALYARAGHPRTLRTGQRYCDSGHLECVKATFIGAAVIGLLGTGTAIAAGKGPGFDDPNNWRADRTVGNRVFARVDRTQWQCRHPLCALTTDRHCMHLIAGSR